MNTNCSACGGELVASSASRFLLDCEACAGTFVPRGTTHAPLVGPRQPPAPARADVPLSAEFRARYELRQQLGAGAMGAVYKATVRGTGREVAVKFLLHVESELHLKRFELETQALASIDHPNVLRIVDHGTSSGHPYLVTEVLGGGSLRNRLDTGPRLEASAAVRITREILLGLAACHARGILHRDLKPENILFDQTGAVRLADLGLAKYQDETGARLTAVGQSLGTPLYMAPEVLSGSEASTGSDLYAVGLILHEMLNGKLPLTGSNLRELIERRVSGVIDVTGLPAPAQIKEVARRLLQQSVVARPSSAAEVIRELDAGIHASGLMQRPEPGAAGGLAAPAAGDLSGAARGRRPSGATPAAAPSPARPRGPGVVRSMRVVAPPRAGLHPAIVAGLVAFALGAGWLARGSRDRKPESPAVLALAPGPSAAAPEAPPSRAGGAIGSPSPVASLGSPPEPSRAPARPRPSVAARPPSPVRSPASAAAATTPVAAFTPPAQRRPSPSAAPAPSTAAAPAPTGRTAPGELQKRIRARSVSLPLVGQMVFTTTLTTRVQLDDGRVLGLALRNPMRLPPGRVRVFANIEPAPELDFQFGRPGRLVEVRQSAHAHDIARYWVTAPDVDRGTVATLAGGAALTRDWSGDLAQIQVIIADLERARGQLGPPPGALLPEDVPRPPLPDRFGEGPLPPPGDRPRPPFGDGPRPMFAGGPPLPPGDLSDPPFGRRRGPAIIDGTGASSGGLPFPPAFEPPPRPDRVPELGLAPFLRAMADWTRTEDGSCLVVDRVDYLAGEGRVESTVGPVFEVAPWLVPPMR